MKQKRIKKEFDCLAYKQKAQLKIYEDIKTLTIEEEIDYFQKGVVSGPLADWWASLQKSGQPPKPLTLAAPAREKSLA